MQTAGTTQAACDAGTLSIRTRALQVPVLVLMPIQGILCQRKAKQTRPLVLVEPISPIRVEHFDDDAYPGYYVSRPGANEPNSLPARNVPASPRAIILR